MMGTKGVGIKYLKLMLKIFVISFLGIIIISFIFSYLFIKTSA